MARLFYGAFGWMCYDCRTWFPSFWVGLKNQFTNECCTFQMKIKSVAEQKSEVKKIK